MGANIDFNLTGNLVPPLEDDQDTVVSFNLPRKITNVTGGRAVADGAVAIESTSCTYEALLALDRMRLLSEASLVLTPHTYKEGKLYSLKPTYNGNGDFTATRATTATRVNADGLVDLVPYNLLQYSEQFDNAYWTKVNSTITANAETAPNGTLTADLFTKTSNVNTVSQVATTSITYITTGAHTLSVYVKPNVGNQILLRLDNVGNTANFIFDFTTKTFTNTGANVISSSFDELPNGWFRLKVTGNVISTVWSLTPCNLFSNPTNDSMFIWGAQLVEGTSARDYLRTETRLNIPRIDYSLGGCPNILLEPQRTNLALQSSSFDNASWAGTAGVVVNSHISPSGIMDADTLSDNNNTSFLSKAQNYTITANAAYTTSVFVRKTTDAVTSYPGIVMYFTGVSNRIIRLILNTTTGTFNYEVSGVPAVNSYNARVVNFNADYWRVELTAQDNQSNTSLQLLLFPAISSDGITTSAAAVGSAVMWGAQLEAGAYATSFIPTTTASVTRNADSLTRNNIFTNGLITAAGGTWFVELRGNVVYNRDNGSGGIFINTGTTFTSGDGFTIRNISGIGRLSISKWVAGVQTNLYTTLTNTCKIAIKWNGSTADVFVNGVKEITATSFTITAMQNLIGNALGTPFFTQQMALFPTPLTDAQMSMLTSGIYPTAAAAYASLGLVSESPSCLTSTTTF